MASRAVCRQILEVGAPCGSPASGDLSGGRGVTRVPTGILSIIAPRSMEKLALWPPQSCMSDDFAREAIILGTALSDPFGSLPKTSAFAAPIASIDRLLLDETHGINSSRICGSRLRTVHPEAQGLAAPVGRRGHDLSRLRQKLNRWHSKPSTPSAKPSVGAC